jgi:hypothetical protein
MVAGSLYHNTTSGSGSADTCTCLEQEEKKAGRNRPGKKNAITDILLMAFPD